MRSRIAALVAISGGVALGACSSSPNMGGFIRTGGSNGTATGGRTGSGGATTGASGGGGGQQSATGGATPGATGGDGGGTVVTMSEGCSKAPPTPSSMIGTGATATQYGKFSLTITAQSANSFKTAPGQNQQVARLYYVRLPNNYSNTRPYRVVYLGPGCGPAQDTQTTPKALRMDTDANSVGATTDAILVQMEQGSYNPAEYNPTNCRVNDTSGCTATSAYCFDDWASETPATSVPTIPDGNLGAIGMEKAYFDALHKAVEANYCVDKSRQFFAGYSSGGWMAHQLGCWFPDVLRAQASVTGGIPPVIRDNANGANNYCVQHPIAAFLIHNNPDVSNGFPGSVEAATRLFRLNGCTGAIPGGTAGPPLPNSMAALPAGLSVYTITDGMGTTLIPNNASFRCYQYTTCPVDSPIVFCVSTDSGHQDQQARANPGFWQFFAKF